MFDDVVARPQAVRPRRSPLLLVSLTAHAVAIGAAVAATLAAPDTLPFPQKVLAYFEPVRVRLVDIELPATPRARPPASKSLPPSGPTLVTPMADTVDVAPTPLVPPADFSPETGREGLGSADRAGGNGRDDTNAWSGDVPGSTAPPEPPAPAAPVRLHSGIRAPRKIADAAPVYPALARTSRVEGVVILDATIDRDGGVVDVRVLRSVALLDQAALDAVRQWRFEPARLNGEAIPVVMTITVRFALDR